MCTCVMQRPMPGAWKSARMAVLQGKSRSVLCSKNLGRNPQKLPMASHYVPGEGRLNLIAPRRTCRGQRDILRGTPLRPCWGCKSGSTRHCCAGPYSAFAAAHKFYQLGRSHKAFLLSWEIQHLFHKILKRKWEQEQYWKDIQEIKTFLRPFFFPL